MWYIYISLPGLLYSVEECKINFKLAYEKLCAISSFCTLARLLLNLRWLSFGMQYRYEMSMSHCVCKYTPHCPTVTYLNSRLNYLPRPHEYHTCIAKWGWFAQRKMAQWNPEEILLQFNQLMTIVFRIFKSLNVYHKRDRWVVCRCMKVS